MTKLPFEMGMTHYDEPLPDVLEDLDELRRQDRFRFANELRAWITNRPAAASIRQKPSSH